MENRTLMAPAKINLALDVTGRRADGYHLLWTIMQSIGIGDLVTVETNPGLSGIRLSCGSAPIPADSRNTAWRAAKAFIDETGIQTEVRITIEKRIPAAAGLAGGSTDAAAVLTALDSLYPGLISRPRLFELATQIGADVPFCLQGGTVLCEGIGEILSPLPVWENLPVLLCKPAFGISTPWVFKQYHLDKPVNRPDQAAVLDAVHKHDLHALAAATGNVLEAVSLNAYPVLGEIKQRLHQAGSDVTLMSGSGPTVFGLFSDSERCSSAVDYLTGKLPQDTIILMGTTIAGGPQILR